MFLMLRLAVVIHLLLLRNASSCESWEYSIEGECCPKCGAGLRVLRHCTRGSGTSCVSCNPGWFTEHPNGLTNCLKCRECPPGNHMQVKERCHYTKNTKCTCQPGFFCIHQLGEDSCDVCVRHTIAPPGFRVTQLGTENDDVLFEPCPLGTFSAKKMSFSCMKWTNCSEKGLLEKHTGNATSDVVCGPQPKYLEIILPVIISLLILAPVLTFVLWKNKKCLKALGKRQAEELPYTVPEKESMVKPVQETNPNLGQPSYANL
ncbi:tumor necrosis factor receptor superfamily member 14 isoform X1 [Crotalus tigris]|uniref:tumor necrosis factor receptor superfamily member 14 isoform X1 n=2 Tax=Crotalus tigris TaxID=88082 RepID=UPI00192F6E5E|nr:tumor necrosis factor receptor superfamily member 14 isoform X1 [Crotalus tigris]